MRSCWLAYSLTPWRKGVFPKRLLLRRIFFHLWQNPTDKGVKTFWPGQFPASVARQNKSHISYTNTSHDVLFNAYNVECLHGHCKPTESVCQGLTIFARKVIFFKNSIFRYTYWNECVIFRKSEREVSTK